MQKKTIHEYYKFGTAARYLQDAKPGFPVHSDAGIIFNLSLFLEYLDRLDLAVTKRLSAPLQKLFVDLKATPNPSGLEAEHATKLRKEITSIRKTLGAELKGIHAFIVTPKILDTSRLLEDVPNLFSPSVFSNLPELARFDFTEAGRCIAFELPTAAAFHLLRATEMELRHFYNSLIKQKRIKSTMWGPIVSDLRSRPKAAQHLVLLNHLDHIRNSFRNPTQHPEKIYDIHEAQDLWSLCIDATNRMQKIINAL